MMYLPIKYAIITCSITMDEANQIIRALNASIEKAREEKLKKFVYLKKCLDIDQLSWFLKFKNSSRSTFDSVFATPCSLRFIRNKKENFEIFFDENG